MNGKTGASGATDEAAGAERPTKPISRRRMLRRARDLMKETRLLAKKKGKRIPESALAEVTEAHAALGAVMPSRKTGVAYVESDVLDRTISLDNALTTHLGSFRKSVTRELIEAVLWAVGLALLIRFFLIEAFSIPSGSMLPTLEVGDHLFINKVGYGLYAPFSPSRIIEWSQPERGDVVVFVHRYPGDQHDGKDYIKRVIAVPGDRVRLEDHVVWLNGAPIPTEVLGEFDCPVYNYDNASEPTAVCKCTRQRETLDAGDFISQHLAGGPIDACRAMPGSGDWPHQERPFRTSKYFGHAAVNPDWPEVVVPADHVLVMGDNRDHSEDGRFWGFVPYERIKGAAFLIWWARDKGRLFSWIH